MNTARSADDVVVWIDADEWYPVYDMRIDNPSYGQKALLSKADYAFVLKATSDFDRAQEILKAADKAARNDGDVCS